MNPIRQTLLIWGFNYDTLGRNTEMASVPCQLLKQDNLTENTELASVPCLLLKQNNNTENTERASVPCQEF